MGSMSAEKLVKYTLKSIAKMQDLDYDELKSQGKKVIKMARDYDQQNLGFMEDLLDLGNVGCIEELFDFDIEVLKMYCRIKELDDSLSDRKIVESVWKNMQEEFEQESDSDSEPESEDSESETETEIEVKPDSEPEVVIKKERRKKKVIVM